ncbi:MAG TPA: zf-HC2 domain-containing protein [Candidatus Marinimicrobia bacterium]|nr:zf-HC2 domain-containing protein [Candidatus Neomarinimicrobiota bacterium]HRS50864.1 zf-HC2 domain-containing protein [Candidatus Neomarinimicrobiota bacterium]HRU91794.1 zf-HC2 domain-containing protein [Candidatus Neomarinimicrobiota bacterium]
MKHNKHFKELLILYFYNELPEFERVSFEQHLDDCPVCQAELKHLRNIEKQIARAPEPVPSARLLEKMNKQVMLKISSSSRKPIWAKIKAYFEKMFETITLSLARPRYQLIAASLVLIIGIFIGRMWFSADLRQHPETLANFVNYNYKFTDPEKENIQKAFTNYLLKSGGIEVADLLLTEYRPNQSGLVEVNVRVEKDMAIKGGLDDPTIQNMLMYAARHNQNAEKRLMAIRLLDQIEPNPIVDATFVAVMLHDKNESVRLLAAQLLTKRQMTAQALEAYKLVALRDSSASIRKLALENLVRQGSQDVVPVIAIIAARDESEEIRQIALVALDKFYDKSNQEQR